MKVVNARLDKVNKLKAYVTVAISGGSCLEQKRRYEFTSKTQQKRWIEKNFPHKINGKRYWHPTEMVN